MEDKGQKAQNAEKNELFGVYDINGRGGRILTYGLLL